MKKRLLRMAAVGLMVLGVGCSSSPFVGTWQAENLPAGMPRGTDGTLVMSKDGAFVTTFTAPDGQMVTSIEGEWGSAGKDTVEFMADGPEGERTGRGIMGTDGKLRATAEGQTVVFRRVNDTQ